MRIWNYFKRTKCLVRGASLWDIYVNMLPFNSFEMSFLLICNCPLQSLVSLMLWNNMTIVSWLPPMPETVFFFVWLKLSIAPYTSSWGTIEDGTGTRWEPAILYCMLHQRSINSFNFLIACAKTQVIHYSNKLFRSTGPVNCFWQSNVHWCLSFTVIIKLCMIWKIMSVFLRVCYDFIRNGLNVMKKVSHDSK